ncbi:MAG: hypothetical protein H6Q67_1863 [Firmicutes bacterium]|nr:hypothetical protein [Bacillota bacterium]
MKKLHELTGKELEQALKNMGKNAIAEAHAKGNPTAHGDAKGTYLLYPDGHKEYIDDEGEDDGK